MAKKKKRPQPETYQSPPRVALVIETTRAHGRRILRGIGDYLRENGPWLIHVEPRSLVDAAPDWLSAWDGDGIIARVVDEESAAMLASTGIPVVNLKASASTSLGRADIVCDRHAVGEAAAEHLLQRGFRHFAFIGVPGFAWSDLQFGGFCAAVEAEQCECRRYDRNEEFSYRYRDGSLDEEIDEVAAWLASLPKPLGVLAADDFLGVQILSGCRRAGLPVPDAVGVLGVDNEEPVCQLGYPPLSSVVPDDVRIGREAAALLSGLMRGCARPESQILVPPLGVVTRQSTDVVATDDELVAEAMRFIRERAGRGINVGDVVSAMNVSRSVLQRRFREILNRSVYDIILEIRLDRVKELLSQSRLSLREIAVRAGFRHTEHMNSVFKQKTGWTLGRFRAEHQE